MENKLFGRKGGEKITSQEELHDFMRVTSPRLWMLLGALLLLLVGFIVYAATASIENTMKISVEVQNFDTLPEYREQGGGEKLSLVSATLPSALQDTVRPGMRVRFGQYMGTVSYVAAHDDELSVVIDADNGYLPLPDGVHEAELILESATPISFLWN